MSLDALSERQPQHAVVVVLAVAGLASLVAYWLHAARTDRPLFPLALFKVHTFSVGVLGNLFSRVGSGGMPYLIPLMMQVALGYSPMHAGMMMIPAALAGMFSKRIVVPLVRRLGYRRVLVGNTVLVGARDGQLRARRSPVCRCGCMRCSSPASVPSIHFSSPP